MLRVKYAARYTLTALGAAMLMFYAYILIADPEKLSWYETFLTFAVSTRVADWACGEQYIGEEEMYDDER